jgi:hypothetical protein
MIIIGVDFHPSFQQIAFMDQETGECDERQLNHSGRRRYGINRTMTQGLRKPGAATGGTTVGI